MKIRIKRRDRIQSDNLMLFLGMLFVFSYALLEHVSISISLFSMVKSPLLVAGGICILFRALFILHNCRKRKYFYVILTVALLCVLLLLSAVANRNPVYGTNALRGNLRLVLFLAELFALVIWIAEEGKTEEAIRFLFGYVLILVVATDVLLLTGLVVFRSGRHETYLIGTKFTVAYFHMDLLTLWFIRNNMRFHRGGKSRWYILPAILILLAVSIRVDCMTGVIGCLALFCFLAMLNTKFQRYFVHFSSPVLLLLFLAASIVFPFIAEQLVSIGFVSYLLENVFLRSTTLTGRLTAFTLFAKRIHEHWLWGFGVSNGNAAAEGMFGLANAQNALLQWILEAGIPATLVLVFLMLLIFQQLSKSPRQNRIMPMAVLLYVYVILGMVETTFNLSVVLLLALIFMQVNTKEPRCNSQIA